MARIRAMLFVSVKTVSQVDLVRSWNSQPELLNELFSAAGVYVDKLNSLLSIPVHSPVYGRGEVFKLFEGLNKVAGITEA